MNKTAIAIAMTALSTTACETNKQHFEPQPITVVDGKLTPEVVWQMARVGSAKVSPDGRQMVFAVTYTDVAEDRNYADVYTMSLYDAEPQRLTKTDANEMQVGWRPDGKMITYMMSVDGKAQLFEMQPDGTKSRQISHDEDGIDGYVYSPDMKHVAIVKQVKLDQTLSEKHSDMPKTTARLETDLMYRHWNKWSDGKYSHVFVYSYSDGQLSDVVDVMEGERFHSPMPPFGSVEQIAFSPDGRTIIYTCKKLAGQAAARSTNSGLYAYDLASGSTRLLTEGMCGYDMNPRYSPDGTRLYWQSMERDGYESDKNRLMMLDFATGQISELTDQTEMHVEAFCPSLDGKKVWFIADDRGREALWNVEVATHKIELINRDLCDYTWLEEAADGKLVVGRMSMSSPTEIYLVDTQTGVASAATTLCQSTLAQIKLGHVAERWVTTSDNKQMLTWVITPPDFDPSKRYPALLYCQGGPQSTVSQFWSLRWNFQLMASRGYVVVAPNRRGLPGFGREWNEQISGDYGGQNMQDYLSAIDDLAKEPWVDENRLGAVGASYGGFSVYWLAGHHEGRFKAFIAHCGVFDLERLYSTTEELFFPDWDLGGAPWETDNQTVKKSYSASPHLFVNRWDTPIMVIHGEKDFRIPYTQGMAAFNIAQMKGIPSEFLFFPDECHWVTKPQNSIVWHREFAEWLDKWLK